jgi:hypothetical protein
MPRSNSPVGTRYSFLVSDFLFISFQCFSSVSDEIRVCRNGHLLEIWEILILVGWLVERSKVCAQSFQGKHEFDMNASNGSSLFRIPLAILIEYKWLNICSLPNRKWIEPFHSLKIKPCSEALFCAIVAGNNQRIWRNSFQGIRYF